MNKKEYLKNWYQENREKQREYKRTKYLEESDKHRLYMREYRKRFPDKAKLAGKKQRLKCIATWEGYIPSEANCQCCGKLIFFNKGNNRDAICFDHKNPDVAIKTSPSSWLRQKRQTPENKAIWESCNFGILCVGCNKAIPTVNRKQWLENITRYINKTVS